MFQNLHIGKKGDLSSGEMPHNGLMITTVPTYDRSVSILFLYFVIKE